MSLTFPIGRWFGIPVKLHISWLLVFLLIAFSFGAGFYPMNFRGWEPIFYWIAGFVSALLFWASVLGHELAHAIVARIRGVPIRGITLFALGGAAELERDAEKPADEFIITIVGPLSSVIFGGLFYAIFLIFRGSMPVVAATAQMLATINISLAVFNMIPGFPLDGGRVLRAAIWGFTKDFMRATMISARIGQAFGWLFIAWGLAQTLLNDAGLSGLWIVFIGWFLNSSADQTLQQARIQELLRGVRASNLMRTDFAWVQSNTMVQDLVYNYFFQTGRPGLPVIDNGRFVGLVTLSDIKELDQSRWPVTPVSTVMTPYEQLATVTVTDSAEEVLRRLQEKEFSQVPVLDQGRLVGMITVSDVLRMIQTRQELGVRGAPRATGQAPGGTPA